MNLSCINVVTFVKKIIPKNNQRIHFLNNIKQWSKLNLSSNTATTRSKHLLAKMERNIFNILTKIAKGRNILNIQQM